MTLSDLPYDRWLEDALRGVIRRALAYTADYGLPGAHHFYITFATGAVGVELTPELYAKYPEEMTIVLQHQFWDLTVQDDLFSVTLKFHGRPSRLVVPLAAITAFGDPSVNFGLQLKGAVGAEGKRHGTDRSGESAPENQRSGEVIALDTFRKK
jgi:uncharacterized protein